MKKQALYFAAKSQSRAGVHSRLSIEEQNVFAQGLFPNIGTYISEYSFQNSLYAYCYIYQ